MTTALTHDHEPVEGSTDSDTPSLTPAAPQVLSRALMVETGALPYDPATLTEGIVHIGVGNFYRAHVLMYLHRLMAAGQTRDWAVCGVGLLDSDMAMFEALKSQDYLYTVVERGLDGDRAHIVGALTSYLHGPSDPRAVVEKLAHASTRIVTLTVTEGGYYRDEVTGKLNVKDPTVHQALSNRGAPALWLEYLREGAKLRRDRGVGGFTVWSCDNVQGNGDVARAVLLAFIEATDAELATWVRDNVTFPNSMVDRITPRTTPNVKRALAERFGIADAWPVPTEVFTQFIVEDDFFGGVRPAVEAVGVQFVTDVKPYEVMKLRLLNASHSWLAYLGSVAGRGAEGQKLHYVHDVAGETLFKSALRAFHAEVMPLAPPVPGVDLPQYCETLLERFANPAIEDELSRICSDGPGKMPKFMLASVHDQLQRGGSLKMLSLGVAGWLRYLDGFDDFGNVIQNFDPKSKPLQALWQDSGKSLGAILGRADIFGEHLQHAPAFVAELQAALGSLYALGVEKTLVNYAREAMGQKPLYPVNRGEAAPEAV